MFKKFQDWFFNEDIDELDLDETMDEEEVDPREIKEILERSEPVRPKVEKRVMEPERKVVVPVEKPVEKVKVSFDIKADGPILKKEEVKEKVRPVRRDDFDMPQVISPYFGVKDENISSSQEEGKKVTLNNITSNKKKEHFNDVISPIYGMSNHDIEVETQSVLEEHEMTFFHEEQKEEKPTYERAFTSYTEEDVVSDDTYDMLEEEENMALDEIIADTNTEEDDLIQFSLFGDNKRIQEETFENEEMDSEDDALPF